MNIQAYHQLTRQLIKSKIYWLDQAKESIDRLQFICLLSEVNRFLDQNFDV